MKQFKKQAERSRTQKLAKYASGGRVSEADQRAMKEDIADTRRTDNVERVAPASVVRSR